MGDCKFKHTDRSGLYFMVFIILYLTLFFPRGCTFNDIDNREILNKLEAIKKKIDELQL